MEGPNDVAALRQVISIYDAWVYSGMKFHGLEYQSRCVLH